MTRKASSGRENGTDPKKSPVSTPAALTPDQHRARHQLDWGAIKGALQRLNADEGEDA